MSVVVYGGKFLVGKENSQIWVSEAASVRHLARQWTKFWGMTVSDWHTCVVQPYSLINNAPFKQPTLRPQPRSNEDEKNIPIINI